MFRIFYLNLLIISLNIQQIESQTNKFLKTDFNSAEKKGEFINYLAKNYTPNAYTILQKRKYDYYAKWVDGRGHSEVLSSFATAVHETCHSINFDIGGFWDYGFFISSVIELKVDKTEVFKSSELDADIPEEWKTRIFRYTTYLQAHEGDEYLSSIKDGIYGLMDEFDAYYQSTRAAVELYGYYKTISSYTDPYYWSLYLSNCYSSIFAYYEFRLFMAWYLKYAKSHYPDIYSEILKNKNLKVVFTLIDLNYSKVIDQYFSNRKIILENINKAGVKKADVSDKYFYIRPVKNTGSSYGYGIPDADIIYLKSLFTAEDYQMLKLLTIENLNENNYQSFAD